MNWPFKPRPVKHTDADYRVALITFLVKLSLISAKEYFVGPMRRPGGGGRGPGRP